MNLSGHQLAYLDKMRNMAEDAYGQARGTQDETVKKVFEALNNKTWGASSTMLMEIARDTSSYEKFGKIFKVLWEAADSQPRNWRKIFKALMLCEYLVKNGSERCVDEIRDHTYKIRQLQDFRYMEDRVDRGQGVREKAKQLLELLSDNQNIRDVRDQARKLRDKFVGVGSGGGGQQSYSGSGGASSYSGGGGYSDKGNGESSTGGRYSDESSGYGGGYSDGGATTGRYSQEDTPQQSSYGGAPPESEPAAEREFAPALNIRMKPKTKAVPKLKMKTAAAPQEDLFAQQEPSTDLFASAPADFDPRGGTEEPPVSQEEEFADFSGAPDDGGFDNGFADFAAAPEPPEEQQPQFVEPTPPPVQAFDAFAAAPPLQPTPIQPAIPAAMMPPAAPQMMMPPQQQYPPQATNPYAPRPMYGMAPPTMGGGGMMGMPPAAMGGGPMAGGPMGGGPMSGGGASQQPQQQQQQQQQQEDGDFGDFEASPGPEPPKKDLADTIVNLDSLSINTSAKAKASPAASSAAPGKRKYAHPAALRGGAA